MVDGSEVDAALLAILQGDATLSALMPDGIWFDVANPGATRFVIVAQLAEADEPMFGATAFESYTYLVKAVAPGKSAKDTVLPAARRIRELLDGALLTPDGYGDMRCARIERVRYSELDEINDVRWHHRGGHYEVIVSPTD
jgi:hypothetical protein